MPGQPKGEQQNSDNRNIIRNTWSHQWKHLLSESNSFAPQLGNQTLVTFLPKEETQMEDLRQPLHENNVSLHKNLFFNWYVSLNKNLRQATNNKTL